jgi:uncharacterized protein YceH (UPF0502 family)
VSEESNSNDGEFLDELQVRVLGCLIEKEATTPDQYPLTINALKNACNQKSNRDPVTDFEEGEIGHALRQLEAVGLVHRAWSSRAERYEHRFQKHFDVFTKAMAVLSVLMLRGPQTVGEIRTRSQRIHAFDDLDDVAYELGRLMERDPPLIVRLPRQPGQKDDRYVHLLAGEPDLDALAAAAPAARSGASPLAQRLSALEAEIAELKARLEALEGDD